MKRIIYPFLSGLIIAILTFGCTSKEMKKAKEFMEASMYEQAILLLEIEIQANPKNAEASFLLGKCYLQISNNTKVEECFNRAILLNTDFKEDVGNIYFEKSLELYKDGDFSYANSYYEEGLKYNPAYKDEFANQLFNYTSEYSETTSETEVPIYLLKTVDQISPDFKSKISGLSFTLAKSFIDKGFISEGFEYAEFGIKYDSKHIKDVADLYFNHANDLLKIQNKPYNCISYFERCIVLNPEKKIEIANIFYNQAKIYETNNKIDLLLTYAKKCSEINPDYGPWYKSIKEKYKTQITPISHQKLTEGLIAYYPFNGSAVDVINGYNGEIEGATSSRDRFGNNNSAFSFDGVNDRIIIPRHDYKYKMSRTFNFWFKIDDLNQVGYFLHGFETTNVTSMALGIHTKNKGSHIEFDYDLEPGRYGWFGFSTSDNLASNTWHMLTVVYKAGVGCFLYLNGKEKASNLSLSKYNTRPQGRGPITVGNYGNSWFLKMFMDDLSIWNRALSSSELLILYNSGNNYLSSSQ